MFLLYRIDCGSIYYLFFTESLSTNNTSRVGDYVE